MLGFRCKASALLSILVVAGCGGGGKDNSFKGDTLAAAQAGFAAGATGKEMLILEDTTLTATFPSGRSVPLVVRATADPATSGMTFIRVNGDRDELFRSISASFQPLTGARNLNILTASSIPPGTYTGTIQITACVDPACSKPYANSPVNLSYDFEVTPPNTFSAVPAVIVQTQAAGESSEAVVTLIPSQPLNGQLHFSMGDAPAVVSNSESFVVQGTSIVARFRFLPTLAPGRYEWTVGFSVCYDTPACFTPVSGSPFSVPYSLTVTP